MLNEIQKNIQMGHYVRFGLFAMVMVGLVFLIIGVRLLTLDLPKPEEKAFRPRMTKAPAVSVKHGNGPAAPAPPKTVEFVVDGVHVEGTIQEGKN